MRETGKPKVSLLYDPKVRSIAYQLVLCAVIVFLVYSAATNAINNLAKANIASGFGFWNNTAGFDISQTLIEYSTVSTYGRAFWVGLLNTLHCRRHRHRAGDHPRIRRRRVAAVEEFPDFAARRAATSK